MAQFLFEASRSESSAARSSSAACSHSRAARSRAALAAARRSLARVFRSVAGGMMVAALRMTHSTAGFLYAQPDSSQFYVFQEVFPHTVESWDQVGSHHPHQPPADTSRNERLGGHPPSPLFRLRSWYSSLSCSGAGRPPQLQPPSGRRQESPPQSWHSCWLTLPSVAGGSRVAPPWRAR